MGMSKAKDWIKEKAVNTKEKVDGKLQELWQWSKTNPEQAAAVAIAALGAGVTICRRIDRGIRLRRTVALKERYIYDHWLGSYWKLRRKPTQSERLKIERLRRSGLSYGDILTRLRLL